ncbi:MAG: TIGR01777 family protein [Chloroflexi bacterium]|nr:TIGR01777 family protein [Chloroflexota bacterium]
MRRVIITGGTGFLGRALAQELRGAGSETIFLSRYPARAKNLRDARVETWDARTSAGWSSLITAETVIVNLAGASIGIPPIPWTASRRRAILESRTNAGRAIVDAIHRAREKPRALIQASAVGYYGPRGDELITEDVVPGNDFLARVCVEWENATREVESFSVRRVVIRTGLPLSFRDGVLPWFALPFRFFIGGALGSGKQYVPWIHLADHIRAVRFLIENDSARGAFNLSAPNPVTNRDFARALGRVLHRPAIFPTPGFALKLALGELAELLLLSGQRQVPHRLLELGYAFKFSDVDAALRDVVR